MLDSPGRLTHGGGAVEEGSRGRGPDDASVAAGPAHDAGPIADDALVRQARGGDLDAFNALVVRYQDFLFGLVVRVLGQPDAAADVVQVAFLSAYRHLGAFKGGAFRGWLARIALNAATDVLRDRKRRPSEPYPEWQDDDWQPPAGEEADPEREAVRRARGRALASALAAIGEDQRRAIVLFDVEGFDYGEIAELTGVSLGTVKSRIHRGRLALRELLAGQLELFHD